ncbi:hypothetical protein LTS08_006862 [Lithohypha guttulata]|uniref:Zn(2)-C6 fungal-type domain-containing protein n=1 Tax=Lithohypha guttulata TaxID=1690604 RepID=A0AAN7T5D9_9EURO|nr:hypothetical protein LTR05_000525 [Lithohypha guttulata]KAK5097450.1 hypothetical protein LTS08_006862 [Lithohypha guttulata]
MLTDVVGERLPTQILPPHNRLGDVDRASQSGSDADSSGDEGRDYDAQNKKRKRSMKISCELCKARKVKCDKEEPACGWCSSHGRLCVYRERKRPGVRATYEIDLEEKVNRMEAMLQLLGARVEDHIAGDHVAKVQEQLQSPAWSQGRFRATSIIDGDPRSTPTPIPSWRPGVSRQESSYGRPSDTVSVRSLAGDGSDTPSQSQQFQFHGRQADSESELPPYDLLYSLVDLYFKHVATWSPILDRKNTFDTLFGRAVLEEPDRILLHAIVAVTLRFSRDPRLTRPSRRRYHDISKQKVQLYGLENPNIRALQALVILAIDILGTSNGPQGWNLLALIARNVVQLGLNVEKSVYLAATPYPSISCLQAFAVSQPASWTENEARRRLLWMVYVLDRYTTVSTSFNFTLDDSEVDRPLPCSYDLFSQNEPVETKWFRWPEATETVMNHPDNLGSFAYHCEVLRILSRIHKFLNRPVDITSHAEVQQWRNTYVELDSDLNSFLAQLPGDYGRISQLCHSDPASKIANWIMLHAAFVTSIIRLHSAAGYPIVCSSVFMPSQQAMHRCLAAVESLRAIAQDVMDSNGLDLLGPPFAFSLWAAARVLLVHAAATESTVDLEKIAFFISTLEQMGHYWEVAGRYAKILDRLVNEGQKARETHSGTHQPQQVRSFTAMRSLAYELNQLVSQRPRSVLSPTSTRLTSLNELEYLDVFDSFNYPRLRPASQMNASFSKVMDASIQNITRFDEARVPTLHSASSTGAHADWLGYRGDAG